MLHICENEYGTFSKRGCEFFVIFWGLRKAIILKEKCVFPCGNIVYFLLRGEHFSDILTQNGTLLIRAQVILFKVFFEC